MADRIKIRRGSKEKCDLAQYEIGYLIDERRICIADGDEIITFLREDELEDLKATIETLRARIEAINNSLHSTIDDRLGLHGLI